MVKHSIKAENDGDGCDREDAAEMDVDHEEKMEIDEGTASNIEAEEEEIPGVEHRTSSSSSVPFLDTFYSLSSVDPQERAQAAQDLIQHCLVGPDSNIKDASYALKRLLNGLCSGRAAARQGNASALASFVKIASQQGKVKDIQNESRKEGEKEVSELSFIRNRLVAATEPSESQGKLKASEERDLKFGRLFGILAVVRSTTLLPLGEKHADIDETLDVSTAYVKDLAALYSYKKWMREPAAHAVGTLLNSYYSLCSESTEAVKIVHHLVNSVVVPDILARGDNSGASEPLFATYSAEQIALALHIQSNISVHSKGLSEPINQPVLTKETMPYVAQALSDTSTVTQPRTHLVWDTLCSFISEPVKDTSAQNVEIRKMKEACPVSSESVHDLLEALMRHVVIENLLGMDQSDETCTKDSGKTTHERSALALCLIRNFSGVEFVSSISGRTRLILEPDIIENVIFTPTIVKILFFKTITAGMGKKQSSHLLRPLALHVLESIAATFDSSNDTLDLINRRLAFARPLLRYEPRFDTRTKTGIVAQLIETEGNNINEDHSELWSRYIHFLENQVASVVVDEGEIQSADQVIPFNAGGYLDHLFNFAKMILRRDSNDKNEIYRVEATRRILGYLMAAAFFDCQAATESTGPNNSKKKKKAREVLHHPAVQSAALIRARRSETPSLLPYNVRSVASARFYSLVAEYILVAANLSPGSEKEWAVLDVFSDGIQAWDDLENTGALSLDPQEVDEPSSDNEELEDPKLVVKELRELAEQLKQDDGADNDRERQAQAKCSVGFAILASALYIHLLSCGRPEELVEDDPDADDDNDAADVRDFITDLKNVSSLYSKSEKSKDDDDRLSVLTELCVNILSSPLSAGNQSRGGSPKLLREAVRYAWIGGLMLSAAQCDGTETESNFLDVLLESIGAEGQAALDKDGDHSDKQSNSDSDVESNSSEDMEDPSLFARAAQLDDIEMKDQDDEEQSEHSGDVELDPERLQSLLEEDSDADVSEGELEHHAGADKALAKLIQMKQEARKVGQMAREQFEITQQIRCTMLLEILVGRTTGYGWGTLLTSDRVLQMFVPILHYIRVLERSISKAAEKGSSSTPGISQKTALRDRLTLLLKGKILKMKHSGHRHWRGSVDDVTEVCSDVASKVLAEMKGIHVNKEHLSCCSSAIMAVIRAIPESETAGEDDKIKLGVARAVYEEAVREWSTKRTTRLESTMFEDFSNRCPVLAQATLVSPLTLATTEARSLFLKRESFRLLSLLYSRKVNMSDKRTGLEEIALNHLASVGPILDSFKLSLQDPEMKKSKWAKELLRSLVHVFTYIKLADGWGKVSTDTRIDIAELLNKLKSTSDSKGVQSGCDKLLELMKNEEKPKEEEPADSSNKNDEDDEEKDDGCDNTDDEKKPQSSQISKKKRKKKKSKKRKR